jgi:hypothetical protein
MAIIEEAVGPWRYLSISEALAEAANSDYPDAIRRRQLSVRTVMADIATKVIDASALPAVVFDEIGAKAWSLHVARMLEVELVTLDPKLAAAAEKFR